MELLRRVATASLVFAALHSVRASAQATEPAATVQTNVEQVPGLLRSDDYKQMAWGAYLAGQYRVSAAVPLLEALLERIELIDDQRQNLTPGRDSQKIERIATALSALDALVQLNARIPAPSVERFFDRWPIQTLVLVGNAVSGRDEALLSMLERGAGPAWTAAANLLLETKPPGFAVRLLRRLTFHLNVTVVSKEDGIFGGTGLGFSGDEGCMYSVAAVGYPPMADYDFSPGRPGATVLAVGPHPVFYIRRPLPGPGFRPCGGWQPPSRVPSDQERLDYVQALIAVRVETPRIFATTNESVVWAGARDFLRRIAVLRRRREGEYERLIEVLMFNGQLSRDESRAYTPAIDVRILDKRDDRSQALPAVH